MLILGIDTATALTTVALSRDDAHPIASAKHLDARRHAEVLPRLVRQVLDDSGLSPGDLDLVAVGVGPGPFTGLRVGVTFARAMAHALGIPVVGAVTLDVVARAHPHPEGTTVVSRSRRVEVAWATYDGDARRLEGPLILPDQDYPRLGCVVGDVEGVDDVAYPSAAVLCELVRDRLDEGESLPNDRSWPEDVAAGTGGPTAAALGQFAAAGQSLLPALPLYLRRPDAVPA
ncbi:MAG: tRNA ((37)-N6)-threonylcarbamoyltransferase complex dimerization subunit type 1 TsaB [Actinomycetota bacterium]